MRNEGEFELSQEVVSVLPSDPYEQIDIACRITAMAVATRMSKLETEAEKLRHKVTEKENVIHGLKDRISKATGALQEQNAKLTHSEAEQVKLIDEKNALSIQVKNLLRDVAKLETFKRALMKSLEQEDENPPGNSAIWKASQTETTVARTQLFEDANRSAKASPQLQDELESDSGGGTTQPKSQSGHTSPKQTIRGIDSARGFKTPRLTPLQTSMPSPHLKPKKEDLPRLSVTHNPSSQSTSGSRSPNAGHETSRTARLDGKEFFRQARSRLSHEKFSSFLANIKELNAHRQTREETLAKAEDIFGPEHMDLYSAFEEVLGRHLSA